MPLPEISLLITDIDGSLLNNNKEITDKAYQAVQQLRKAGIQLSLTSSRPPRGMQMYIDDLKITTPLSGFNGGMIVHPDLSVIQVYYVPTDTIQPVFEMLGKNHLDIWFFTEQDWFVPSQHGLHIDHEAQNLQFSPIVMDDFSKAGQKFTKIVGVSDDYDAIVRCAKEMQQELSGHVSAALSQQYYLDITHPKANKGTVIQTLSRLMNIPTDAIATIGDMPSDVYMFKDSGLSIAMGNASDEVKRQADQVTTSNEEEGFAHAVEHFLLRGDK